jgi:hypothetical protein
MYAWRMVEEAWPKMATSGPWAGIAEDLTQQSSFAPAHAHEPRKTLTSACWAYPPRTDDECARPACNVRGECAYARQRDGF